MQTALHIKALVKQLGNEIVGGKIVSNEFYKKERAAYFFIKKDKNKFVLGFVFHPTGYGTFLVPASKVKITTREKPWPIFGLEGATVKKIHFPYLDRIFLIEFEKEGQTSLVSFEATGPNGNLWYLGENHEIKATLRKRTFAPKAIYETNQPDRFDPFQLSENKLGMELSSNTDTSLRLFLEKQVLGFNKTLTREILTRANLENHQCDEYDNASVGRLDNTIQDLLALIGSQDIGYLYSMPSGLEAYPIQLKSVEQKPEKFKSLSMAILEIVNRKQTAIAERDEKKGVTGAVKRTIKRLEKRYKNVEADIAKAEDYETYKKYGELLKISLGTIKKGMTSIEVDDIYLGSGQTIKIKLDPALSPNDNAELYFKKHRKGREGLELLKRRFEITGQEIKSWQNIASELEDNFDHAIQKYESEIQAILPHDGDSSSGAQVRLPYKEHTLSTGATIYIGRDGSDNDRTTFDFAKPFELWFHTQQCPGSHVVLKFPHKGFKPSKLEIEETASIAAFNSKARNDSLVPVIYTERKYVRKPRKAKPGLVTVEREKSLMVKPTKAE